MRQGYNSSSDDASRGSPQQLKQKNSRRLAQSDSDSNDDNLRRNSDNDDSGEDENFMLVNNT